MCVCVCARARACVCVRVVPGPLARWPTRRECPPQAKQPPAAPAGMQGKKRSRYVLNTGMEQVRFHATGRPTDGGIHKFSLSSTRLVFPTVFGWARNGEGDQAWVYLWYCGCAHNEVGAGGPTTTYCTEPCIVPGGRKERALAGKKGTQKGTEAKGRAGQASDEGQGRPPTSHTQVLCTCTN